jgi:CheY-like chemotaxis protein
MLTPGGGAHKILVADDEVVIATTLRAILEQQGYRAAVAFDGKAAVRVARSFEPDVLLADVQMPKMNGIEAALEILQNLPDCNVLLYTAKPLPEDSLAKAKAQGYEFPLIQKPIAPGDLLHQIRNTIRKRRTSFKAVVLNVDDDEVQRYAVTRMLQHAGFVVREARTGAEALAEARKDPALILLDVNLPDMNGFEVCKRLKESPDTAHIPVVHLTSTYRDELGKQKALSLGAVDYFTHPVQPEALFEKLREIIGKP